MRSLGGSNVLSILTAVVLGLASELSAEVPKQLPAPSADVSLVNLRTLDPSIVVDLRYATAANVTHQSLYPTDMPALVRPSVGQRLVAAQSFLRTHGFGLKIWDAYRPRNAQQKLWELTRTGSYVADPSAGIGSMHTRGVAVDATLVDSAGREVAMPTGFDNFTPAAMLVYSGTDSTVRTNLLMLQRAMARVGFYGLRTEWWHFCAEDWARYQPVKELPAVFQTPSPAVEVPNPGPRG